MKKYLIFCVIAIFIIISVIKINIINTEILSPVGNFQDNFNKINEEFGEDFSEFIMDKSPVKIYLGEEGDSSATVKINKKGNFQDNFNKINEEFGEDFSEFIMDKSPVKIYLGEEGDSSATVKINKKEISLTKNNPFLKIFNPVINFFENSYKKIEEKFIKKTDSDKPVNEEESNSELENVVDDFINSLESE